MAEVTIGGNTYDTYVDLATCDAYADGAASADDYRAADSDTRSRGIVSGTRLIDRQTWQGEPVAPGQEHAFPRSGLFYPDGSPVGISMDPQQILDACCELAIAIVGGSAVQDQTSTDNTTRSLKAGSVEIVNFRTAPQGLRMPLPAQELIGMWLGGQSPAVGLSLSFGTDKRSEFNRDPNFNQGF
jgi:hypothetical protein